MINIRKIVSDADFMYMFVQHTHPPIRQQSWFCRRKNTQILFLIESHLCRESNFPRKKIKSTHWRVEIALSVIFLVINICVFANEKCSKYTNETKLHPIRKNSHGTFSCPYFPVTSPSPLPKHTLNYFRRFSSFDNGHKIRKINIKFCQTIKRPKSTANVQQILAFIRIHLGKGDERWIRLNRHFCLENVHVDCVSAARNGN